MVGKNMTLVCEVTTGLTVDEKIRLANLEERIDDRVRGMAEIGEALGEIRESRLYREQYRNFEEYCVNRWSFSRDRADQMIGAQAIVKAMSESGKVKSKILPSRERHVRELKPLKKDDRVVAWDNAVESAGGGEPSQQQVKAAVVARMAVVDRVESPQYGQVVTVKKTEGLLVTAVTAAGTKATFLQQDLTPLPEPIELLRQVVGYPIEAIVPSALMQQCRQVLGI
jgi:hypothetical protein